MNATAHALATALAHATRAGSVVAKGREGTGPHRTGPNGVFSVWSPSIMSSSSVMPDTRDDMMTGTSTIEGIDLDAEVPCDAYLDSDGGGCEYELPADFIVATACDTCDDSSRYPCCRPCLVDIWSGECACDICGLELPGEATRIVEHLR